MIKIHYVKGFEPSIHGLRGQHFTAELFDLLMTGHKSTKYVVNKSMKCTQLSHSLDLLYMLHYDGFICIFPQIYLSLLKLLECYFLSTNSFKFGIKIKMTFNCFSWYIWLEFALCENILKNQNFSGWVYINVNTHLPNCFLFLFCFVLFCFCFLFLFSFCFVTVSLMLCTLYSHAGNELS